MVYCISKVIAGMHFSFRLSRLDVEYPGNFITVVENGKALRVVYAMRDSDRWVFFEKGDPLPIEDVNLYQARWKKDRLTPEIISAYLRRIGYGSLQKGFWIDRSAAAWLLATEGFTPWRASAELPDAGGSSAVHI